MYTYRKWDKKSPINGLSPYIVFKDFVNCENDEFFLIELDGTVTMIQNSSSLAQGEDLEAKVIEIVNGLNTAETQATEGSDENPDVSTTDSEIEGAE